MKTNIIIAILFLSTINMYSQTYNPNSQDVNRILNTKKTTGTPANIENTDRFYFENEAGAINPAFIALADLGLRSTSSKSRWLAVAPCWCR